MAIKLEKVVQKFYEGLEEGKILGRKCPVCGAVEFPPVYACNTCGNLEEMLNLKNISYCHLNDNDGVKDQHITLGEGTLDLNLLKKIDTAIIELNNFDNVLKSKEVIENL